MSYAAFDRLDDIPGCSSALVTGEDVMLEEIRRLMEHARWADRVLLDALRANPAVPADAIREYCHTLGAAEVWLARLERRSSRIPVWPVLSVAELDELAGAVHEGYAAYLTTLDDTALNGSIAYTNTAGRSFVTALKDILLHVALHGQYHRGKVNLLLRQAGLSPAPTDYIAFVRGAPAATTDVRRS
jgi:uncharacterized damage-inducible protein DinB